LHEILTARIEKESIGFINGYYLQGVFSSKNKRSAKMNIAQLANKITWFQNIKAKLLANKYQATVTILSILIIIMLLSLFSQIFHKTSQEVYVSSDGTVVDLTIDDIKKDIAMFKSMDITSDEKGMKYQDILGKLTTLEQKGRWLEDIDQLKKILKSDYFKGFNIITINDLKQFDDPVVGKKTTMMTFNTTEKGKLGDFLRIEFWKNIMIAGTKGALLGATNNDIR
jgi:hypothetical protein